MGRVFKLLAAGKAIEEIAEAVSWHVSDLPRQIFGDKEGEEDIVKALYVVDGAHATPSPQLGTLLDQYDSEYPGYRQFRDRLVLDSVKRAVSIYCGFLSIDVISFIDSDSTIDTAEVEQINIKDTLEIMREYDKQIDRVLGFKAGRRKELRAVLNQVIAPEFDRIEAHLSEMDDGIGTVLDNIAEKMGVPKRVSMLKKLDVPKSR